MCKKIRRLFFGLKTNLLKIEDKIMDFLKFLCPLAITVAPVVAL